MHTTSSSRRSLLILACATACTILTIPTTSEAKTPLRTGVGASFGFGGEYTATDDDDSEDDMMQSSSEDAELAPSFGAMLHLRYTPLDFLSLGIKPGYSAWYSKQEQERELGRSGAINIPLFLQLQTEFGPKKNIAYIGGYGGPSRTIPSRDLKDTFSQLGLTLKGDNTLNYGAMLGLELQGGGKEPGLFIEGTYNIQRVAYRVTGDITNPFTNETEKVDEESGGQFWQIGLNIGVTFAP